MPYIDDLKKKSTKKFDKVEYRPWDNPAVDKEKYPEDIVEKEILDISELSEKYNNSQYLIKLKRGLYGPQKTVMSYLLGIEDHVSDDKVFLKPIVYVEVAIELDITLSNFKSILTKFKKRKLIDLDDYKPGRGGYGCYTMNKDIFSFFNSN